MATLQLIEVNPFFFIRQWHYANANYLVDVGVNVVVGIARGKCDGIHESNLQ
jgi:hypothetical protein